MRYRLATIAALIPLLAAALIFGSAAPRAAAATTVFPPVADSYVRADQPTANFGTSLDLIADASPVVTGYLKFNVLGLTSTPTRATLRVWSRSTGSVSARIHPVTDNSWTEPGLANNNAPPLGSVAANSGALTAGTYAVFDVTSLVQGNGEVSFGLSTGSTASRLFDSRENANPPRLEVETTDPTTTSAPPPTTTALPPTTTTSPTTTTAPPTTTTTAPPTTTTASTPPPVFPLAAVADSYVRNDQPGTNFGTSPSVIVDGSPVVNGYLRFDVQGLTAPPTRATLRIMSRTTGTTGVRLHALADNQWTETGITYTNAPAHGAVLTTSGAPVAGTHLTFDVTTQIQANGPVNFGLSTTSTSSRTLDSAQGTTPPVLEIDTTPPPPPPVGGSTVVAAGDAACAPNDPNYNGGNGAPGKCHMRAVSDLALSINPANVIMLGDAQYNSGSLVDFNASYDPGWGRLKSNTRPVVGNHEYGTSGAAGYFTYFGDAATPRQPGCRSGCEGYYSFNSGSWHVVVINTECTRIGGGAGCAAGSPQAQWLDADLAANPAGCTMVVGHRPRWSSNSFASASIQPLIDVMYARGVDLYVAGHSHSYERFAPQNAAGQRDDPTGIREIIAGTGGSFYTGFGTVAPNSEIRRGSVFGVLKLTLGATSYGWDFVADPATPFSDSGTGTCH